MGVCIADYFPLIMLDVHKRLDTDSAKYFREDREKKMGCTLEELEEGREVSTLPGSSAHQRKYIICSQSMNGIFTTFVCKTCNMCSCFMVGCALCVGCLRDHLAKT